MSEYLVNEMVLTLQGEGFNTGKAVVLIRFSGCNMNCPWCDTEHEHGEPIEIDRLMEKALKLWPACGIRPRILLTGGEPLLQVDRELLDALKDSSSEIYLETNGTLPVPRSIDWVCVSPKNEDNPCVRSGDEIKLVWPSEHLDLDFWERQDFSHFWLQPRYDREYGKNLRQCIDTCLRRPAWRLSLQTHRTAGIP